MVVAWPLATMMEMGFTTLFVLLDNEENCTLLMLLLWL